MSQNYDEIIEPRENDEQRRCSGKSAQKPPRYPGDFPKSTGQEYARSRQ